MALVTIVIILLIWGIYALTKKLTPPSPPIDDMDKHLKTIMSLPDQKARQRYLKTLRRNNRNK